MAKQIAVIAIKEMIDGKTTRILWPKGSGPENRDDEIRSIGPIKTIERVVFLMGSITVAVASV